MECAQTCVFKTHTFSVTTSLCHNKHRLLFLKLQSVVTKHIAMSTIVSRAFGDIVWSTWCSPM